MRAVLARVTTPTVPPRAAVPGAAVLGAAVLGAVLLGVAVLGAAGAANAQPSPRATRPDAASVAPCDLARAPQACAVCPGLAEAVRRTDDPAALGRGPVADGVLWTPLYVAFRLDCPGVGRDLVARGADPQLGGRDGVLLVEVAAMRFARRDPGPATRRARAMEWLDILSQAGPFDLDRTRDDGPSAQAAWSRARAASPAGVAPPPDAGSVWARVLALSAVPPVLMPGAERVGPERPAPEIGTTRPGETAMARGAERVFEAYENGGRTELAARVQSCYAEPDLVGLAQAPRRRALEVCAAMDAAAVAFDAVASRGAGLPRNPALTDEAFERRTAALEPGAPDGSALASYRRALRRGAAVWLGINAAMRTK